MSLAEVLHRPAKYVYRRRYWEQGTPETPKGELGIYAETPSGIHAVVLQSQAPFAVTVGRDYVPRCLFAEDMDVICLGTTWVRPFTKRTMFRVRSEYDNLCKTLKGYEFASDSEKLHALEGFLPDLESKFNEIVYQKADIHVKRLIKHLPDMIDELLAKMISTEIEILQQEIRQRRHSVAQLRIAKYKAFSQKNYAKSGELTEKIKRMSVNYSVF